MKDKKLLAISGSPHKNGATAVMLEYVVQEAGKKGWSVNRINLYEKKIDFCTGCRACILTGTCVQNDDIKVRKLKAKVQEAEAVKKCVENVFADMQIPPEQTRAKAQSRRKDMEM